MICNNPPRMEGWNRDYPRVTALGDLGSSFDTVIPDVSLQTTYCHLLICDYKDFLITQQFNNKTKMNQVTFELLLRSLFYSEVAV